MIYTIISYLLSIWGLLAVIGLIAGPIMMITGHKDKKKFKYYLVALIASLVSLPIVFALYAILVTIEKSIALGSL